MEKYTLQEYANLLQNLRMMKEFYSNGEEEKNVGYLTYDSREVTEGTLFICKGAAFKAEYLDAAIEKGAIAYVSEVKYETKEDVPVKQVFVSADDIKDALLQKKVPEPQVAKQPQQKKVKNDIMEVDLHAHELLDTTAGMSNSEILNYQLDVFRKTLEECKNKKGQKIVFIHGKGDGVLRKAILQELKYKYKNYESQDASFREYGFGATMVIIH